LIVALQGLIEELNFETDERKKLADLEIGKPGNHCNDGNYDAAGRLCIGTMPVEARLNECTLYCYDGSLQKKLDGISVSNGICWSNDNTTMYYIDSFDYNIKAYDFELKTRNISNERNVMKITEPDFASDGMCIDEECDTTKLP
jgi:sugar lactone lactonase YvrE